MKFKPSKKAKESNYEKVSKNLWSKKKPPGILFDPIDEKLLDTERLENAHLNGDELMRILLERYKTKGGS